MAARNGNVPPQGQSNNARKFAAAGAAAGGFVGAATGSFIPPINVKVSTGGGGGRPSRRPR
ncbi:sporulation protein SsgA, partial [Streptomyces sp. NPDC056004]